MGADCNNDVTDGCEVQLLSKSGDSYVVNMATAVPENIDNDRDGHAAIDPNWQSSQFCCRNEGADTSHNGICYALPNTARNSRTYWEQSEPIPDGQVYVADLLDDCDDNNNKRYPGNSEVCDGIDNDCDDATVDGSESTFTDAHNNNLKLNEQCSVYYDSSEDASFCTDDANVECISEKGEYKLACVSNSTSSDEKDPSLVCNGRDDDCNGRVDEDYVPTSCIVPNAEGICAYGVMVCTSTGTTVCQPLFGARKYDFYGDGIDSNCDGKDWDVKGAIYVAPAGLGGADGNDLNEGTESQPIATLQHALWNEEKEGLARISDKVFYKDIIMKSGTWDTTEDPIIPIRNTNEIWKMPEGRNFSHDELVKLYIEGKTIQDYYVTGEEYPPKEYVRIIGGYNNGAISGESKYLFRPAAGADNQYQHRAVSFITGSTNGSWQANDKPLSLRLTNMAFEISPDEKVGLDTGTTFVGLNCGHGGCSNLRLINSTITVLAPKGRSHDVDGHTLNDVYGSYKNGVDSMMNIRDNNDDKWVDFDNYYYILKSSYLGCSSQFHVSGSWKTYNASSSSMTATCPDNQKTRGGCGGVNIGFKTRGDIETDDLASWFNKYGCEGKAGESNNGAPGSSYADDEENKCKDKRQSDCDIIMIDPNWPRGGTGKGGKGGKGGKNSDLKLQLDVYSKGLIGVLTYSGNSLSTNGANGSMGTSGGGGAGGVLYGINDSNPRVQDNSWAIAGSGGYGGCGGYGGMAGGTGGSAIGMILSVPASGEANISLESGSEIIATAGVGGNGQAGQSGVNGGLGGKSGIKRDGGHCAKATAGGGGGGGAGAAGRAGHAYGIIFVSKNSTITGFNSTMKDNGFIIDENSYFYKSPASYVKLTGQYDGPNGSDGVDGGTTEPMGDADGNTAGGNGGQGGAIASAGSSTSSKGTTEKFYFIQNTKF